MEVWMDRKGDKFYLIIRTWWPFGKHVSGLYSNKRVTNTLKGVPQKRKIPKTSTHNLQTSNSISKSLAGYERHELPVPGFENGRCRWPCAWRFLNLWHASYVVEFDFWDLICIWCPFWHRLWTQHVFLCFAGILPFDCSSPKSCHPHLPVNVQNHVVASYYWLLYQDSHHGLVQSPIYNHLCSTSDFGQLPSFVVDNRRFNISK